ncbi:putative ABC transport system permease protein [Saccharothrix tamanrassetensis]|uniref:Putative ABC transport system permease protein n=1 Tax=Saccharothrix tamanrassetensis TaxID=1051531 RepID=A0A841CRM7_9PSEU|nr:ABC transporter permease [Saccharothrix tamanrassetensis]MBB5958136.1 putative ABC transport system permease protein [Saccharothrix tamanrassetensis]
MSALGEVVRSGVGRRRVQAVVIGLSTLMAVTASVLGATLLDVSNAPFDKAFAEQRGSHLTVRFSADKTTTGQLTANVPGVTATSGPFPTVSATPHAQRGQRKPMTLVGRADPGGPVDAVTLSEGRWAGPGELVLSADTPMPERLMGSRIAFPDLPGGPTLTVVGVARSVSRTADGWVSPATITAPAGYQVLYRLASADTADQVDAAGAAVAATVPEGGVDGARSWLAVKREAVRETAVFVPFLVAFGLLGVVMSVLVVGNVVAGAVGSGTRRIGILKALGFTPSQVVRAYVAQALIPAAVGTALGVVAGNLLAIPMLAETEQVYGTATLSVAVRVVAAVAAGALGVVAVTAWASAARAGRLRTVDAIAVGRAAPTGRGRWATRLTARLPLPRPVGLGLARPFARPARAAALLVAVAFGTTAVTLAIGLVSSLAVVQDARQTDLSDVVIGSFSGGLRNAPMSPEGPRPQLTPATDRAAVTAAIDAQAGTKAFYSIARTPVAVAGVTASADVLGFGGDLGSSRYQLISGTWFRTPGEAVVPSPFLNATGTRVGDDVTLEDRGQAVTVRIVGEVFDTRNDGMRVLVDAATFPEAPATSYHIAVEPGTDVTTYLEGLNNALRPLGVVADPNQDGGVGDTLLLMGALIAFLTLMLVAVAGLGVFNAVVLDTRDRVRDLGVHKALGTTPRQVIAMVVASVVVTGLIGGAVGVPAGVVLHQAVLPAMGESAGTGLPAAAFGVYGPVELALLVLGGVAIAVLGALLPAGWAAGTRTATALRAE